MGMSLERVQYKFASIIGELCSQPDVLSQFAVWLDLRLAEYKLKGAISLDCSGEEPDPVWLKGLSKLQKPGAVNSKTDRRTQSHSPSLSRNTSLHRPALSSSVSDIPIPQSHSVPSAELAERLSPDVVVVKEEPDVYPVSLHVHDNRKRSAADTVSTDFRDQAAHSSSTPSKQRRISSTESPSHQSLMSVIGGFDTDTEESNSKGDHSTFPSTSNTDNVTLPDYSTDASTEDFSALNNSASDWADQSAMSQDSVSNTDANRVQLLHSLAPPRGQQATPGGEIPLDEDLSLVNVSSIPPRELNRIRRAKITNVESIPKPSVSNMVGSVGIFERWLWERQEYHDRRFINDIPPETLAQYLTEFFRSVTTPSGSNYKSESFLSLRCSLFKFLKVTSYPVNPNSAPEFADAREAFAERRRTLL